MQLRKTLSVFPIFVRLLIFLGYLIGIVYASLASPRKIPKLIYIPNIDKVVHFIMYLGFCFLGLWLLNTGLKSKSNTSTLAKTDIKNFISISVLAIGWGFFMEVMQRYLGTGRHYSIYDLYANIGGAVAGACLYYLVIKEKDRD